jgi:phenylacetate-CoA ligase
VTRLVVSEIECRDWHSDDGCRYGVQWAINPHMEIGSVDFYRARREHSVFVSTLRLAGAEVVTEPFLHGAFDSVFIKDAALLLERRGGIRALIAQPRHPERRLEQTARADAYKKAGYDVVSDPNAPIWEGGDVVVHPRGTSMFLGYGPRSASTAAAWLERQAGVPVIPLELCDPHLYHLDTAMTVLPDGCALVCASALTDESLDRLQRASGITTVIVIPRQHALGFGLNVVPVGETIVCGSKTPAIASIIRERGFRVTVSELDQFHLAGGSAACLVAAVHRDVRPFEPTKLTSGERPVDLYGHVFRKVAKPMWERYVRRRPVLQRQRLLERTQYASLDALHALQTRSLRRLVDHAYKYVPFYRERFDAAGLVPSDITKPEDLAKLPILRRADLQGRNDRIAINSTTHIARQTSGTTGEPLLFGFELDSEHWRHALRLRAYQWAGFRPGDKAIHFWGARLPTPPPWRTRAKVALDRRLHREHHVPCDVMNEERLAETVQLIREVEPQVLICYAQAGAELARYINRNDLRTWTSLPVICGAERLLPRDRADLEAAFGPRVFDTYGCREVMLIGAECEARRGLHLSMENLIVEIIVTDGDVQRPAREGETGEVVITDLHNLAMPFIRYANGDIATAGSSNRCTCGRTLPRIEAVQGRLSETLRDGHGAAISGLAISFLFHDVANEIRQFQAVQHKDHSVSINVVPTRTLDAAQLEALQANSTRLLRGVPVRVNVVPELPRSAAGKHRLVVVER